MTAPTALAAPAHPLRARRRARAALALLLAMSACGPATTELPPDGAPFKLVSFGPYTVLPGTRLVVRAEGLRSVAAELRLEGTVTHPDGGSARLDWSTTPRILGGTELDVVLGADLLDAAGGPGDFRGKLVLAATLDGVRHRAALDAHIGIERELTPRLTSFEPTVVYLGDTVRIGGSGFLLGGEEGDLEILATGRFVPDAGQAQTLENYALAVRASDRENAVYVHTPELFGLQTGEFTGTLVARNRHRSGEVRDAEPIQGSVLVLPSTLVELAPGQASRGQKVSVAGHGFYASVEDGTATELRLDGTFTPTGGAARRLKTDLPLQVDSADQATWVLQPALIEDRFEGFGAEPGVFTGSIAPVLSDGRSELVGVAWKGSFRVLPVRQVVHLKFLPGFIDALKHFGLRNLEQQVRERIFEVARRDYADFNVEFRDQPPADFATWTTVELTGDDPNEADLFGLDNTVGKDTGNVRLADYVGGKSSEQEAIGSFAYGGVFLASFLRFSPDICRVEENGIRVYKACPGGSKFAMKSERFNEIFKPFAPMLGGVEATVDEWAAGTRSQKVREAVRVLGSIAGNTLVHELGHSLGLAQETGLDEFHNAGDTPGFIMNPGGARPFEERAELEGTPAVWAPGDRDYLLGVLPRE